MNSSIIIEPTPEKIGALQVQAQQAGLKCVVNGLVVNENCEVFVMKRSWQRHPFPGSWDLPGGRVEEGETFYGALSREIREETGWSLARVLALVNVLDWEVEENGQMVRHRQFDFVVQVNGDLTHPITEVSFLEGRWVGLDSATILTENRPPGDSVIYDVVVKALTTHKLIQMQTAPDQK